MNQAIGILAFVAATISSAPVLFASDDSAIQMRSNKAAVEQAFEAWSEQIGSPFTLLADDISWTIVGSSGTAGTYTSDQLHKLIAQFNTRITEPLRPTNWMVFAEGETIAIQFEAQALLKTGEIYTNEYAWFFEFEAAQVVDVRAFLDLPKFERALAGEQP